MIDWTHGPVPGKVGRRPLPATEDDNMPRTPTDADDSTDTQPTDAETWYTVVHNGLTVHTQDADAADHASRSGARVTATTGGWA